MDTWPARLLTHEQARDAADPWVMYLVVDEMHPRACAAETLAVDAIRAALRVHALEEHEEVLERWWQTSFRKVTLRAKLTSEGVPNARHARLLELPGAFTGAVWASVPMQRSQDPATIRKAQVLTEPRRSSTVLPEEPARISLAQLVPMSTGKLVAQACHAGLLLSREVGGMPDVLAGDAIAFSDDVPPEDATVVVDAGLTEVDPLTPTVAAWYR